MTRKCNKNDMTITEQLEAVKTRMCDDYCRYQELSLETIKDPDEAFEWLQRNYCQNCPLSEL